jgi:hypothetical protein
MKIRFTLSALLAVMAALLVAFASPALAKGGGGGGGGGTGGLVVPTASDVVKAPCATVDSWTPSVQTNTLGPVVVVHVGVLSTCLDEGIGAQPPIAVSFAYSDAVTGARTFTDVKMSGYGQRYFDFTVGLLTATPRAQTLTVTVTRANGQLQYSRTTTVAEVMLAAQAAQPAA